MEQIWKDIAGYEGLYQVSREGAVRSLNYRNRGLIKELTQKEAPNGQLQVELSKDGKRKIYAVQRLVGEAFPPETPVAEPSPPPMETPSKPVGRGVWQQTIYGERIKKWDDVSLIRKELGYQPGTIHECCQSPQKSAYGFKWQYAE